MDKVTNVLRNSEGKDRLIWEGNFEREYIVKSGYNVLNKEDSLQGSEVFQTL